MKQQIILKKLLKSFKKRIELTEREISCLVLAANGMTTEETADLLGIKASTVETYRKGIKRKLASNSMAQAVYQGMKFGYMDNQLTQGF